MTKYKILCVDDDKTVLDTLQLHLNEVSNSELSIETAQNAVEALEVYEELLEDNNNILLIISDFSMPIYNSDYLFEALIKKGYKGKKIILTGHMNHKVLKKELSHLKIDKYFDKPWNKKDLIDFINEIKKEFEISV